ncbi:MAG: hypothetical protein JSW07_20150 [bacterium]|nr:MAG: hypothetical protein JSW07_20150 [bacterium]
MNKTIFCSILFIVVLLLGCAGQLALQDIIVEPKEVVPGDDAKIFVVLKASKSKVASVVATVREVPDFSFSLNNEGKDGDEKAGDNVWSYQVMVPWEADAGIYHLDISVRDKDGNEIIARGLEQRNTGRSGSIEVIIK